MKFKRKLVTLILLSTMITSMLSLLAPARAYKVDETAVCFGYDESTLAPEGISTTYLTTSEYVGFWANITSAPTNIHIMWKDPDQNQYQSNLVTVVQKTGKTWGIVFNKIQIAGTAMTSPSNHAGVWTVQLWINDGINSNLEDQKTFQIIDYANVSQQIISIQDQVQSIVAEKNNLQNQYQDLQNKYLNLQSDYLALQSNTTSSPQLSKLQSDYNNLLNNYRDLQGSLGTTRMLMYAAVVVAIASILIAVYFGVIKR